MSIYAGSDVSDKTTHICVVDAEGKVLRRDVVAGDPNVLAKWFNKHCADLARVVLETGTLSTFHLLQRAQAILDSLYPLGQRWDIALQPDL